MKDQIQFIQHAVYLNYLKPGILAEFFKENKDLPLNISEILIERGLLTIEQCEEIDEHIQSTTRPLEIAAFDAKQSLTATFANGSLLEIPIPDSIFPDPDDSGGIDLDSSSDVNMPGMLISPYETLTGAINYVDQHPETKEDVLIATTAVKEHLMEPDQLNSCIEEHKLLTRQGRNVTLKQIILQNHLLDEDQMKELQEHAVTHVQKTAPPILKKAGDMFLHYQIQEELGRGGMGVVYKAYDTKLERIVALKLILGGVRVSEVDLQRFIQESKVTAQLEHPNIVKLFEVGDSPQNYFTMEYVDGKSLDVLMKEKKVELKEIAALLKKVSDALHWSHSKGIIHRDVKPSNIMINSEGEPKIMDFGLAKLMDAKISLSMPGEMLGTPAYMSPEQANGAAVDAKTDVYSVGATLYDCLTGRPPFQGDSYINVLQQIFNAEPIRPKQLNPDISPDLEAICLKCLEKPPKRRYLSAGILSKDIQNYLEGRPVNAEHPTRFTYFKKFILRNKLICSIVAGFILFIILGTLAYIHEIQEEQAKTLTAKKQEEKERRRAEQEKNNALEAKKLAEKERNKAVQAQDLARIAQKEAEKNEKLARKAHQETKRMHKIAIQEKKRAEEMYLLAKKNESIAIQQRKKAESLRKLAEREKEKNYRQAKKAKIRLALICLQKSKLAHQKKKWRESGVLAGTALEFLKDLSGRKVRGIRKKAWKYLNSCYVNHSMIWRIKAHTKEINAVAFSPNGKIIASASKDQSIKLWDSKTGKLIKTFAGHEHFVNSLCFDPTGKILLSGSEDNTIVAWSISRGRILQKFTGHSAPVTSVHFSPDGVHFASASDDNTVKIWHIRKASPEKTIRAHDQTIKSVRFSRDGKQIITGSIDRTSRIWDVETGRQIRPFIGNFAVFSPDRKTVITLSGGTEIFIWNARNRRKLKTLKGHKSAVTFLTFHPQGKLIATSCGGRAKDRSIRIWTLRTGKTIRTLTGHDAGVNSIAFSPNGKMLISVSRDKTLCLWYVDKDKFSFSHPKPAWYSSIEIKKRHKVYSRKIGWIGKALTAVPQKTVEYHFGLQADDTLHIKEK